MTDDWFRDLAPDAERISIERQAARHEEEDRRRAASEALELRVARNTAAREDAFNLIREAITRATKVIKTANSTDLCELGRPPGLLGRFNVVRGWHVDFDWRQLRVNVPGCPGLLKEFTSGPEYDLGCLYRIPGTSMRKDGLLLKLGPQDTWLPRTITDLASEILPARYKISRGELVGGYSYQFSSVLENVDPNDYEPFAKEAARVVGLGFVELLVRNGLRP